MRRTDFLSTCSKTSIHHMSNLRIHRSGFMFSISINLPVPCDCFCLAISPCLYVSPRPGMICTKRCFLRTTRKMTAITAQPPTTPRAMPMLRPVWVVVFSARAVVAKQHANNSSGLGDIVCGVGRCI